MHAPRKWLPSLVVSAGLAVGVGGACAAEPYAPQPMLPNPLAQPQASGRPGDMALYPAQPHPGYPGADSAAGRSPWSYPQWQPYPGSVEHYRIWNQKYIAPIPPYNYRTLLKRFPAQDMAGVTPAMREMFAEPVEFVVRGGPSVYPGEKREPVPVVRLRPGGARLRFTLEPLPTGLFAVRLIAAIEPENVEPFRASPNDLIVTMTVNDGPQGETRHYALRQRGTDNFYSIGEFFVHVEDARPWEVTLGLHGDSNIDLLVHTVDVHDMLAETAKRAGKTRSISARPDVLEANWARDEAARARQAHEEALDITTNWRILGRVKAQNPDLTDEEVRSLWRRTRDDGIWNSLPPKNFNFYKLRGVDLASQPDPATAEELKAQGRLPQDNAGWFPSFTPERPAGNAFWTLATGEAWRMVWHDGDGMVEYTVADLLAHKPLPGLPFEVRPWGRSFELGDGKRSLLFPITQAYNSAFRHAKDQIGRLANRWVEFGIADDARDGAMYLARFAYDLPSYTESHAINDVFSPRGAYFNRVTIAHHFRRWAYQYIEWEELAQRYDKLFPYIQGNQELADAIGRHVKWVKTPDDVIALLDTYVLQYGAREALYFRYYYNHQHSRMLANFAALQTDPEIAEPWVKAMFDWTWEYPHRYGSVEDFMYLATQRDGTQTIGSVLYAHGGSAVGSAAPLIDEFIAAGGDPRYRLSDIRLFPRIAQFPFWLLENGVAGRHAMQVGDVGGPTTAYARFDVTMENMTLGWSWTKDPRFAWMIVHHGQRRARSDEEWAELVAAAATVGRDPLLSNRSRVLNDWGAILEGNADSDEFQQRQAARIRIGIGEGHAHSDTLDLGIWSHGLTMAGDMGGRGGYGRPATTGSLVHNLVTIDKGDWMGHAWARELADLPGVQVMNVEALRGRHYSRQVALIEGEQPYFVDVARTIGGREHSYNFHGPTEDLFEVNLERGAPNDVDAEWLKGYVIDGEQWAAQNTQVVLRATWRMARAPVEFEVPGRGKRRTRAPEPAILGNAYDAENPRTFLRVHLPGQQGLRVRSGVAVSAPYGDDRGDGDWLRRMHVIREQAGAGPASSLFAAVWEPYAGESFVDDVRMEGDPADATSFAALHVDTRAGRRDLIHSDTVRPQERSLAGEVTVNGRFAYLSRDADGLRQASLVGGRRLAAPELRIETAADAHATTVTSLDYLDNVATTDRPLPGVLAGRFFEVGTEARGQRGARWSTFEVTRIDGNRLVWRKGADGGTGLIESIEPMTDIPKDEDRAKRWQAAGATADDVLLHLRMPTGMPEGRNRQVALMKGSDGPQVSADAHGQAILLKAANANALGLGVDDRVRLYEIAVGDTFRTSSQVSIRRHADRVHRVDTDVPCTIVVHADQASCSTDGGATWQALAAAAEDGWRRWEIPAELAGSTQLRLRW